MSSVNPVLGLKTLITNGCTSFKKTQNPAQLHFVVRAICNTQTSEGLDLGLYGTWLEQTLEMLPDGQAAIEQVRKRLLPNPKAKPSAAMRFFRSVLSDPIAPATPPEFITALTTTNPGLHSLIAGNAAFCIGHAASVKAKKLIEKIINFKCEYSTVVHGEFAIRGNEVIKMLQNSVEGDIIRKGSRGILFPSPFHEFENNYFFLRWLPEDLRKSLDTLYISDTWGQDPIPSMADDIKGVLPVKRIVVRKEEQVGSILNELPEVSEVLFTRSWGWDKNEPALSQDLKNRLKTCALELHKVQVTTVDRQQFLCELLGQEWKSIDWTKPFSCRYEPPGWQKIERTPFTLPAGAPEAKSLMHYTFNNFVRDAATNPSIKMCILEIFNLLPDHNRRDDFHLDMSMTRDQQLGPLMIKWMEELWREGKIDDKTMKGNIRQWSSIVDSVPFTRQKVTLKDGSVSSISEVPARLARSSPREPLPARLNETTQHDALNFVDKLICSAFRYDFEGRDIPPATWLECARCAKDLQLAEFLPMTPDHNHQNWTRGQIQELKQICHAAGFPEWFEQTVRSPIRYGKHMDTCIPFNKIIKLQSTAWWDELKALCPKILLPSDPLVACQEIVENPGAFQYATGIVWQTETTGEHAWAVIEACNLLPNLRSVTTQGGWGSREQAVTFWQQDKAKSNK